MDNSAHGKNLLNFWILSNQGKKVSRHELEMGEQLLHDQPNSFGETLIFNIKLLNLVLLPVLITLYVGG
ncbi:hypothetical protein P3390_24540 [Vibrio parahaemolyticus]|nr:hypothetical protein [Vibrio parahaemolyticus]